MKKSLRFLISAALVFFAAAAGFSKTAVISNCTNQVITDIYIFDGITENHITQTLQLKRYDGFFGRLFNRPSKIEPDSSLLEVNLKPKNEYNIVLESEHGFFFAREHINISSETDYVTIEFKDINRVERRQLEKLREIVNQKAEERKLSLPYYFVVSIVILLGAILLCIFIYYWSKGNPKKLYTDLIQNGVYDIELAGLLIMIIPLVLSLFPYKTEIEKTYFWFFKHRISKEISINATMLTALGSIFMYLSFVARYGIFKTANAVQKIFSTLQMIINCWCIAGLLSMFVGNETWSVPVLDISSQTLLLIVIALSWLGAKSIAGFMWIILLLSCITHITDVNNAMGPIGAVYIISFAVSLFLQLISRVSLQDLKNDFNGVSNNAREQINSDLKASGELTKKAASAALTVATGVPVKLPESKAPEQ